MQHQIFQARWQPAAVRREREREHHEQDHQHLQGPIGKLGSGRGEEEARYEGKFDELFSREPE